MDIEDANNWLLRMRKALGKTQEEMATALSVTTRTVINWENGHHQPKLTIRQVKALCSFLDVSIDEIPDDFPLERNIALQGGDTD